MGRAGALVVLAVAGALYARADARARVGEGRGIRAPNYRGAVLPVVLGVSLAVAIGAPTAAVSLVFLIGGHGGLVHAARLALLMLGGALVFLAGVHDDLSPGPRGLAAHLRQLARGRLTSGGVKLAAGMAAAALAAAALGVRGWAFAFGVPAAAGATNSINLLDVRPGRALKVFLPVAAILTVAAWRSDAAVLLAPGVGAGVVVLPLDLGERAMLGDAGANLLGFLVGAGLLARLHVRGLAVALGAVLILHALAETVTLSRVIRSIPPLRWADEAGRTHRDQAKEPSASS